MSGRSLVATLDGRLLHAVPDGCYVAGPGHAATPGSRCEKCGEPWPCRSADRVTVWYEDEDRPDDASELHTLTERAAPSVDRLAEAARDAFYAPPRLPWPEVDPADRAAWMDVALAVRTAMFEAGDAA